MNTIDPAPEAQIPIAELPEGREVVTYVLCVEKETATDRNGKAYLRLKFRDASGEIKAIHFDPSDEALAAAAGDVVKIGGTYSVHAQYGPQFQVRRLRRMEEGEYDPAALIAVSPVPVSELHERLAALIDRLTDPYLRVLLEFATDGSRQPGADFLIAPAAVRNHHAYRHGLLEHSLIVAEVAAGVAANFATVNVDLVLAGGLLHDIGKTQAYSTDMLAPGFTDAGRLHGEIVIGHDMVAALIAEIPGFPTELATQLRHIIISHHGEKEKGSPVIPMTREAIIVHYCDDMTARVGACDDAERAAAEGDRWSPFSKMLETFVYLGPRETVDDDE
jgi:3'-5' exoribonuclease